MQRAQIGAGHTASPKWPGLRGRLGDGGVNARREGRRGFESGWAPSLRQGLSSGMGEMPLLPTAELVAAPRCGGLATRSLQESRLCGKSDWRAAWLCAGRLPLEGVPHRFPSPALGSQGCKPAWVTAWDWGFLGNSFALFYLKISRKQLDSRILSIVWQEFAECFK